MAAELTWPVIATIGHRVHVGVGERGDEVRRAGARGRHADAHPAGRRGVALGGVAGALLVAHEDVPHLDRVEERVVGGQDRAAGDAEDGVDVHRLEREHEALRAGHLDRRARPRLLGQLRRARGAGGHWGNRGRRSHVAHCLSPLLWVRRSRGRRPCTKKPSSPVSGTTEGARLVSVGQTRRGSTRTRATGCTLPAAGAVSTGETAGPTIRNREVAHAGRASGGCRVPGCRRRSASLAATPRRPAAARAPRSSA